MILLSMLQQNSSSRQPLFLQWGPQMFVVVTTNEGLLILFLRDSVQLFLVSGKENIQLKDE